MPRAVPAITHQKNEERSQISTLESANERKELTSDAEREGSPMCTLVALQQRCLRNVRVVRGTGDLDTELGGFGADEGVVDDGADGETEGGPDLGHGLEDGAADGLFVWETNFGDEEGSGCKVCR